MELLGIIFTSFAMAGAVTAVISLLIVIFDKDIDNAIKGLLSIYSILLLINFVAIFLFNQMRILEIAKQEQVLVQVKGYDGKVIDYQLISNEELNEIETMGTVIYKFDLNDPEDRDAIKQHAQADDMAGFIWQLTHNNKGVTTLDDMNEKIEHLLEEYNLNAEELTH